MVITLSHKVEGLGFRVYGPDSGGSSRLSVARVEYVEGYE